MTAMKALRLLALAGIAAMTAAAPVRASDLLGPIDQLQGKHIGDGEPLSWKIEYLDAWGRTFVDAAGGHFFHDRCCGGFQTYDPSWIYPQQYYGQYPMYYFGTTMRYRITLTNNSNRTYNNLRVVAIQEYLTNDNTWGEWLTPDAAKDWYLPHLGGGESVTFEGTLYLGVGSDTHGGLDQTHLQVQHWNPGGGIPGAGSVIIDDAQANIFCPPAEGAPNSGTSGVSGNGAAATVAGTVSVASGARGYLTSGGSAATITVNPVGAGVIAITIVSQRGATVASFARQTSGGVETFSWNGLDAGGRPVASGVYLVSVTGPGVRASERLAVVR
jgi:hypothetical protein